MVAVIPFHAVVITVANIDLEFFQMGELSVINKAVCPQQRFNPIGSFEA